MAVRGGYGLSFDRLMNLPAENYRNSPPLRATVVLGQFFGTPQFTYSLGDPSQAVSRLSRRSGAAGRPRSAQRRHRRARQPDDGRSQLAEPVRAQLVLRRPARDLAWASSPTSITSASAGRNLYNAYNINRYVGDLLDGTLRRVQSELSADQHGDLDVEVGLSGRHASPCGATSSRAACCRAPTRSARR